MCGPRLKWAPVVCRVPSALASASAQAVVSWSRRCCGSVLAASARPTRKAAASKAATSERNAPKRTYAAILVGGTSGEYLHLADHGQQELPELKSCRTVTSQAARIQHYSIQESVAELCEAESSTDKQESSGIFLREGGGGRKKGGRGGTSCPHPSAPKAPAPGGLRRAA